jgi:hypothetical protein
MSLKKIRLVVREKRQRRSGQARENGVKSFPSYPSTQYGDPPVKNRADIRYTQAMLGHASINSTQVYTRLDLHDLKAPTGGRILSANDKFCPLGRVFLNRLNCYLFSKDRQVKGGVAVHFTLHLAGWSKYHLGSW